MKRLHLDLETYSPEPIAKTGLYRYAMHPDFDILLVAYAIDEEPVQIIDLANGSKLPDWFVEALLSPQVRKVEHICTDRSAANRAADLSVTDSCNSSTKNGI